MIEPRNRTLPALAAVLSAAALSVLAAPALGAATVHFTPESYSQAQAQIASGKVQAVTFNKKAHTMHITLSDGRHVLASYPSHDEPAIAAQIRAKGATVSVEKTKKKKAAVHHKLRYIAGGALIVVILIVALVLGLNRRKPREEQAGAAPAGTVPPAAGGGAPPPPAAPGVGEAEPVTRTEPPAG